jgi:hypothetical protein
VAAMQIKFFGFMADSVGLELLRIATMALKKMH